jgi:REP element-mobilizing transposase RayT
VFTDEQIVAPVVTHFRRTADRCGFSYLAYCLMPDHAHALVEGLTDDADLRRFVKAAKESSGRAYFRRTGRPLWQEGYYEHVLRKDEDAIGVARYILHNPVRAGIVRDPGEYPFTGSDRWAMAELLASV